jgi:hypothetical protein
MILLDTSYLIALALPEDSLHGRALAWTHHLSDPFFTSEFVLCEFVNGLSSCRNRRRAHKLLANLRANDDIDIEPSRQDLFEAGLHLHADRPDQTWSLTDCISFVLMKEAGSIEALTHDHHFEQAGFRALLREEPKA